MNIVERLRKRNVPYGPTELMDKAADEIERLQTELADERAKQRHSALTCAQEKHEVNSRRP